MGKEVRPRSCGKPVSVIVQKQGSRIEGAAGDMKNEIGVVIGTGSPVSSNWWV